MRRARPAAAAALPSSARVVGVALVAAVVLSALAVPVLAHGNHATADSQVSADGTVVVESAFASTDAFLVAHRVTDDGDLGEPVGHTDFPVAQGFAHDVAVPIDDAAWADWQTQEVWVVLHRNDGDDAFDPDEDPALSFVGALAGDRLTLAKGPAAYVGASGRGERRVSDGVVTVPQARLGADGSDGSDGADGANGTDGFLVVRARTDGDPGRVVGHTALSPGTHTDVEVALDESFLAAANESFGLYAELYRDDGDGSFDPAADALVRAGDEPVRTGFTGTLAASGQNGTTDDGPALNTPTPSGGPTDTTGQVATSAGTPDSGESTRASGPGFTAVAAVGSLAVVGAGLVRRGAR